MKYALLILLAVLGGAYVAHRLHCIDLSAVLDKLGPRRYADVQIIDPSIGLDDRPKETPKPAETNVVEEPVEPPPPPKKSVSELKAEADGAQRALDLEIDRARQSSGKTLMSFGGIRFGDAMTASAISLEGLPSDGGASEEGLCHRLLGPKQGKSLCGLGNQPEVFVTPQTRRAFRIEFSRSIERKPGWPVNAATTNLVETLAGKMKRRPFALDLEKYPLGERKYVFVAGETTLTVRECGGERLKLIVEHGGLRKAAQEETAAFRKERMDGSVDTKALTSDAYPNSGMVKFGRVRTKNGTPKAFCGIVFGSLPPYSAKMAAPASSTDPKGFFIDYRKAAKCRPFMNFDHGKAAVSAINGAVTSVTLYSNGPEDGMTAEDYLAKVRGALERKFKAKPVRTSGEGALQEVAYAVGSLEITLGPDPRGGFVLRAVNEPMQKAW